MLSPYLQGSVVESAVGLVLTEFGGRRNAMTVSFFSEVAHHPTTLWVSIADHSYTHELIEATGRFSLIVLHEGQRHAARACGSASGRDSDKCASLDLYRAQEEFWFMEGALASVACRVRSSHAAEQHTLYIADMLAAEFETRSRIRRHLLTTDLAPFSSAPVR